MTHNERRNQTIARHDAKVAAKAAAKGLIAVRTYTRKDGTLVWGHTRTRRTKKG